jgi:acetyltransferase-like isoleucine patch superfamily enzyme
MSSPAARPPALASIVAPNVDIAPGVELGQGISIEPPAILGKPPRGAEIGDLPLRIGAFAVIRPFTTIYAGSVFGDRLQTGQGASVREDNVVGDDVSIGTNAVLEFGNRIGDRVRIHSGCFLELVTIEDDVFVGPNVVFTDDPHPMNCPHYKDCKGGATVGARARIGANSTILPGVKIGENALVGAGSVVAHNVPAGTVVVGNPARVIKYVDDLVCHSGVFPRPFVWEPYIQAARDEYVDQLPPGVLHDRRTGDRRRVDDLTTQRLRHAYDSHTHDAHAQDRRAHHRRRSDRLAIEGSQQKTAAVTTI